MQITLDTENITDLDQRILGMLSGYTEPHPSQDPGPAKTTTTKKAAAPKAAAVPEPDAGTVPSMDAAVARATELVSGGKARVVKDALATCGAARVSELTYDKLGDFLDLLTEIGVKQIEAKLDAES